MYTVRASAVQKSLSALPTVAADVELCNFDPDAQCSVTSVKTEHGPALLLIASNGGYRATVDPAYARRVLEELKASGSYTKEDAEGALAWVQRRARAASGPKLQPA